MNLKQSEAVILRTYPFREADLLVSLFTRADGKIKGIARSAKKSKKRFSGALEPLTYVRVFYGFKDRQEMAHLDSCEVLESPLTGPAPLDYARITALAYVSEVIDQLLPDHDANDAIFRLTVAVVHQLRSGSIWLPLTYFSLWITRLTGFLPEISHCSACGESLEGRPAWFHALADGLNCTKHKRLASSEMSLESRPLAVELSRRSLGSFEANGDWPRQRAADLRKFLLQCIERHIERRLVTAAALAKIE